MNEMNMKEWMSRGLIPHDEVMLKEMKDSIGSKRGYWSGAKTLKPMVAAILSTLYKVGPDIPLKPQEMINDSTRLAAAIHHKMAGTEVVPREGQASCGTDEYDGIAYKVWDEFAYTGGNEISDARYLSRGDFKKMGKGRIVRYSSQTKADEARVEHTRTLRTKLRDMFPAKERSDYSECKDFSETLLHTLSKMYEPDKMCTTLFGSFHEYIYDYKGECDWKDDKSKRCSHHEGVLYDRAVCYYTKINAGSAPVSLDEAGERRGYTYNNTRTLQFKENNGYTKRRITDGPDDILSQLVTDDWVIHYIKKVIPQMRTESRHWLVSRYESWDNAEKRRMWKGKRGHYQLSFWKSIDKRRTLSQESVENASMTGTCINGWRFDTNMSNGNTVGRWLPIKKMVVHCIGRRPSYYGTAKPILKFRTKFDAISMATTLNNLATVEERMCGGKPAEELVLTEEEIEFELGRKADPRRFTPAAAFLMLLDGTLPKDYPLTCYDIREIAPPKEVKA